MALVKVAQVKVTRVKTEGGLVTKLKLPYSIDKRLEYKAWRPVSKQNKRACLVGEGSLLTT